MIGESGWVDLGALSALICGIFGLIVGSSDDLTWKLGPQGWFTGGTVFGLLAVVMYLDGAAVKSSNPSRIVDR
jgi:hypothetical protein